MKKLVWIFIVVILMIVIGGVVVSWIASKKAEENLRNSITMAAGNTFDVQFESSSINTFTSQFTIKGLRFFDRESQTQINISSLNFDLPYREWLNIAGADARNAINLIETGQIRLTNLIVYSGPANSTVSMRSVLVDVDGNIGDVMRSISLRQSPGMDQNIGLSIRDVVFDRGDGFTLGRASTSNNSIESINGRMIFDAKTGEMTFESFRLSRQDVNVDVTGGFVFTPPTVSGNRETIYSDLEFTFRTRGGNIDLGFDETGVNFRSAQILFSGTIPSEADLASLLIENDFEMSLQANQLQFTPPRKFREGAGRGLSMLGFSIESMIIPELIGDFKVANEQFVFDRFQLEIPFAQLNLMGAVKLNKDEPGKSEWQRTRITVDPKTEENRQIIASMSNMMGFSLRRDGNTFSIPIYGSVSAPRLTQ